MANGSSLELSGGTHAIERCQEFSNMVNGCIYRDSAAAEIPRATLESARNGGLSLILSAGIEDYERIDLPAGYIQGFLQAVH